MSAEQITAISLIVTPICTLLLGVMTFRHGQKLNTIHTLVNSAMGNQLLITWKALERIADLTNDANDIALADTAEKLYIDHQEKTEKSGS